MTVQNLNFARYPHLYSLPERLVLLRLYRRALRSASRLITVNRDAREELSERLGSTRGASRSSCPSPRASRTNRLPVRSSRRCGAIACLPTSSSSCSAPSKSAITTRCYSRRSSSLGERERAIRAEGLGAAQREAVAPDPELPGLAAGRARGRGAAAAAGRGGVATGMRGEARRMLAVPPAASSAERVGIVVCGRRSVYADSLLEYARGRHMASRVDFIYELEPDDLPALFRLAHAFVYLPDAGIEASIVPVVEAMRAGVPMVLSDTQLNREAAGDAAAYVRPEAAGEIAAALENVLSDANFRREMKARERRRAELFSEYAVARRLIDILQFAVKRLAFPKGAVIRKKIP